MEPATYNFTIYQGTTFERLLTYKDANNAVVNLSGFSARMKIRKSWGSPVLLELANGSGITLAATTPNLTITVTPVQTAALDFEYAVYDLEIEAPSGKVDRLLEGRVTLHKEVTV